MKKAVLFCWLIMMSLFVFKLWYTLLWVILFALWMTYRQKKRSYCSDVCPVGYLQDRFYRPKDNSPKMLKNPVLVRKIVFLVFWAYLIINIVFFYSQPDILWVRMVQLMFFSLFAALFLQSLYRKRYWCSHVCPVGSVLKYTVKLSHNQKLPG